MANSPPSTHCKKGSSTSRQCSGAWAGSSRCAQPAGGSQCGDLFACHRHGTQWGGKSRCAAQTHTVHCLPVSRPQASRRPARRRANPGAPERLRLPPVRCTRSRRVAPPPPALAPTALAQPAPNSPALPPSTGTPSRGRNAPPPRPDAHCCRRQFSHGCCSIPPRYPGVYVWGCSAILLQASHCIGGTHQAPARRCGRDSQPG